MFVTFGQFLNKSLHISPLIFEQFLNVDSNDEIVGVNLNIIYLKSPYVNELHDSNSESNEDNTGEIVKLHTPPPGKNTLNPLALYIDASFNLNAEHPLNISVPLIKKWPCKLVSELHP